MTDLLAAAKRLGEARRGRAQSWLMSRFDAKTDNYATAVADEQWAMELTMAEAEYLLAARESEKYATQPARPSAHAPAESTYDPTAPRCPVIHFSARGLVDHVLADCPDRYR